MRLEFRAVEGGFEDEDDPTYCLICGVSEQDAAGVDHYLNSPVPSRTSNHPRLGECIVSSTTKSMGRTTASADAD